MSSAHNASSHTDQKTVGNDNNISSPNQAQNFLRQTSLSYHEQRPSGKISTCVTKPLNHITDLSKAYSPGVAYVVQEILKDNEKAYLYTNKSHLVAVISNGTAVLGLGNTGALAAKPVMEGKAALIKALSGLDAIDIEIDCNDPVELARIIKSISPSFGGILLEDIKAPECFIIENELRKTLDIPVFHDDQHGTSIVVTSAIINGLKSQQKKASDVKVVMVGAGAAGYSVFGMLDKIGIKKENIYVFDTQGLIYKDRENLAEYKKIFATTDKNLSLKNAMVDCDIFIGLSAPNILDEDDLMNMAKNPLILALCNPIPEVDPVLVQHARPDAIMCTGRSDLPNQVNNIIAFPYLMKSLVLTRTIYPCEEIKWQMANMIASFNNEDNNSLLPKSLDQRLKNITDMLVEYIKSTK